MKSVASLQLIETSIGTKKWLFTTFQDDVWNMRQALIFAKMYILVVCYTIAQVLSTRTMLNKYFVEYIEFYFEIIQNNNYKRTIYNIKSILNRLPCTFTPFFSFFILDIWEFRKP